MALPILLGWGLFSASQVGAGGPNEEVRLTFLSSEMNRLTQSEAELPDTYLDADLEPAVEPVVELAEDWSDLAEIEVAPEWEEASIPAESNFQILPIEPPPESLAFNKSFGVNPAASSNGAPTVEAETDPAPEIEERPAESEQGEPVPVTWEPKLWPEHCPQPNFPSIAQRRKWEGKVLLRLTVDVDGAVQAVTILESCGHKVLDEAARKGLGKWRFRPGPAGANSTEVKRWVHFRIP